MYEALEKSVHSCLTNQALNYKQELKDQNKQKDRTPAENKLGTEAESTTTSEIKSEIKSESESDRKLKSDNSNEAPTFLTILNSTRRI